MPDATTEPLPSGAQRTAHSAPRQSPPDLPRKVGFWGAIAVLVGVVIGSGIFKTPTAIAQHLGDPWVILAFWLGAGLIALCGALTFAELASRFPRSGGIYVFIREGFGPCPAFVFGWTYMLITKPAAAAGISIIFAEHFNTLTGLSWNPQLLTCAALVALTLINVLGVRGSARFAMALTGFKYSALVGIVVMGVWAAFKAPTGEPVGFVSVPAPGSLFSALVPVMAAIMWTYDGWSDVGAIAGEVKEPRRNLPRVYIIGTLSVIALYLLVNAVYLWHIPLPEMAKAETVAPLLMDKLIGPAGAAAVAFIIIVSTLGSSHASVMTGARVTFAQARDGLLFRFLSRVHPRYETPAVALWVQCALSCTAVLVLEEFANLAGTFVFTMWIFYGMGAVALFVIRRREATGQSAGHSTTSHEQRARSVSDGSDGPPLAPVLPDPLADARGSLAERFDGADAGPPSIGESTFEVPGYPLVPLIFIAASAGMTVLSILHDPKTTLIWVGVLSAGVPVFFAWRRMVPQSDP